MADNNHGHGEHKSFYEEGGKGIMSWVYTLDHKRIGLMYLVSVLLMFALGGLMALLVRFELLSPGKTIMTAQQYNVVFTLHGAIMVFLFIIPAVPAALGNFVLPLLLGTKDVAFPRLNIFSYYIYVTGAIIAVGAIVGGGVDTGWTFYTPYSSGTSGSVVLMVFGAFVLGFSSILTGLNFIATTHKLRAPGMTWSRMPLFCWGIYATSLIQVLATPVLAITLLMLIIERVWGVGIFDPAKGGDAVLFQHFFWFYSHPAVYIMILPGMAIISEIIPTFSKKAIFGYKAIGMSSVAIAIIGFLVWGHHMFVSGQSQFASTGNPNALCTVVPVPLHHRRIDRIVFRCFIRERPFDGYLLCGCPLSLRDDGRNRDRLLRGRSLLVAKDDWPHVQRKAGAPGLCVSLHRIQRYLPDSICSGVEGHAAPLLRLPAAIPNLTSGLNRRVVDSGPGLPDYGELFAGLVEGRCVGSSKPVGRLNTGMANFFASTTAQF